MKKFKNIPTNIITGFLGVGKTTVIRHLLKTKPQHEKWAVLVNEFGEVGIDGGLLAADGIAVKEVPGGCMCCAVGLPSKVAMNALIREHKPDRIIIEPTGLAHPKQVLQQFSGPEFNGVLDIQAMICLVDPWCLSDEKFQDLAGFNEQIALADVLLATKADVAEPQHLQQFERFASSYRPAKLHWATIEQGRMDWQLLELKRPEPTDNHDFANGPGNSAHGHHVHRSSVDENDAKALVFDAQGVAQLENQTQFAHSCGWVFDARWQFNRTELSQFISALAVPRIKGFFKTPQGFLTINKMRQQLAIEEVINVADSSVEMISLEAVDWAEIGEKLKRCRSD